MMMMMMTTEQISDELLAMQINGPRTVVAERGTGRMVSIYRTGITTWQGEPSDERMPVMTGHTVHPVAAYVRRRLIDGWQVVCWQ